MKVTSKLALQVIVGILGVIPLIAGGREWLFGPGHIDRLNGTQLDFTASLDSEFRFLAAFWLGAGLIIYWIIPRIQKETTVFTVIGSMIFLGGLGRVLSIIEKGWPDQEIRYVMILELVAVPLLIIWQRAVARRYNSSQSKT